MGRSDAQVVLEASATSLVRWVENQEAIPMRAGVAFLNQPSYASARLLVNDIDKVVHVYVSAVSSLDAETAATLSVLLHTELPSILTAGWVKGNESVDSDLAIGLAAKVRGWFADLQASGQVSPSIQIRELRPGAGESRPQVEAQAITYLVFAGLEQWAGEHRNQVSADRLAEIRIALGLRTSELAQLLQVSREAIRRWFEGAPIAPERWPDISRLVEITHRLLSYFKAEALPAQVRRRIPGLGHLTPLELIGSSREQELFQFYDSIFEGQVTQ